MKPNKACRVCGCTDTAACFGGCAWVEPDLCSACVPLIGSGGEARLLAALRESVIGEMNPDPRICGYYTPRLAALSAYITARLELLASPGALAIAEERRRQMTAEGWTAEHDDQHGGGELAAAGACYIRHAALTAAIDHGDLNTASGPRAIEPGNWPWKCRWNPKTVGHDLARGGALAAAEYDRLARAGRRP